MATQFENGLTLSQLAERNAELVTEVEKLRAERDVSLNAERVWEKTMMEVCGEDSPASVASEIRALRALRDTSMQALKFQVHQLTAENVALKRVPETNSVAMLLALDSFRSESLPDVGLQKAFECLMYHRETPATDCIIAETEARGVVKFAAHLRTNDNGASVCKMIALGADEFAKQLREGAE